METPEFFQTSHYTTAQFATEKRLVADKNIDQFIIDDLLDFPSDEGMVGADSSVFEAIAATSADSSSLVDNSCNSSFSDLQAAGIVAPGDGPFASELCVPYDDMAELEWLSNIVDESFCSEDLQKLHLIQPQGMNKARETVSPGPTLPSEMLVPAKARSKRSRAAPGNWTSRLIAVSSSSPTAVSEAPGENSPGGEGTTRRCLHCATDKTPQWRTGPMGPKTLCNACGVRYKSGRLVPEYRPAASPTFVLTKHSNSHRKVLELRRQKEAQRAQQQFLQQHHHHHHHQNVMFDHVSNGDDYLIHQHIGPDYRQLI